MKVIDGCDYGVVGFATCCGQLVGRRALCSLGWLLTWPTMPPNRQHSLNTPATLYEVISDGLAQNAKTSGNLVWAADWCAKAHRNPYVYMPTPYGLLKTKSVVYRGSISLGPFHFEMPTIDNAVQVYQGMFSGHRGTSFDNTMLNIAYFKAACELVELHYGETPIALHHVHAGDDVWVNSVTPVWSALVTHVLCASGLVFQPSKQMQGTTGEYRRVL